MEGTSTTQEIDLTLDVEVFAIPGGGDTGAAVVEGQAEAAGWTVGTTCWSCDFTCSGCDDTECFC